MYVSKNLQILSISMLMSDYRHNYFRWKLDVFVVVADMIHLQNVYNISWPLKINKLLKIWWASGKKSKRSFKNRLKGGTPQYLLNAFWMPYIWRTSSNAYNILKITYRYPNKNIKNILITFLKLWFGFFVVH